MLERGSVITAEGMVDGLLNEFLPDIQRRFANKTTSHRLLRCDLAEARSAGTELIPAYDDTSLSPLSTFRLVLQSFSTRPEKKTP